MWKVITSFNLNPLLKLFFYSPILSNNNPLLKIYCKNIVVTFLNCNFLFFILFFPSYHLDTFLLLFSFFLFFFSLGFFSTTHVSHSFPLSTFFFFFFQFIPDHFFLSLSLSLSLYFFYFYFYFLSSLAHFTHTQPADMAFVYLFLKKNFLSCFDSLCCYNGAQIGFHALDLLFSF